MAEEKKYDKYKGTVAIQLNVVEFSAGMEYFVNQVNEAANTAGIYPFWQINEHGKPTSPPIYPPQ